MATVFISQKVDLGSGHEHSLLNNANADAVIILPESSGVNSAGQVLTVYSNAHTSRYALVVTGQNGTGELTVAGNYDRHASFPGPANQELADGNLLDNPNSPALQWVQDKYKNDIYYQTNAQGEVPLYLAIDPDKIAGTGNSFDNQLIYWRQITAAEIRLLEMSGNMKALEEFALAVKDAQDNWWIPDFGKPADENGVCGSYSLQDLRNIYNNGDKSVLFDANGEFIWATDRNGDVSGELLEYNEVKKETVSSLIVFDGIPAYKYDENYRDENGHPVYDSEAGKRLPVLEGNGAIYRVDSAGQVVYYQKNTSTPAYVIDPDTKQVISYKGQNVIFYTTDQDGNFVYYKVNDAGEFVLDENGAKIEVEVIGYDDNGNPVEDALITFRVNRFMELKLRLRKMLTATTPPVNLKMAQAVLFATISPMLTAMLSTSKPMKTVRSSITRPTKTVILSMMPTVIR